MYWLSALALLFLSVKGYCGKKTSMDIRHADDPYLFSLIRMLLCVAISFALLPFEPGGFSLGLDWGMTAISALGGICNAAFLVGWMLAVRQNTMVLVDVTLTIGSLLPALLCALLFDEPISPIRMIGFALILAATVILAGGAPKTAVKRSAGGILLLLFASVGEGLVSFSQQLYKYFYTPGTDFFTGLAVSKSVYHIYTYLFTTLTLAVILAVRILRRPKDSAPPLPLRQRLRHPLPYIAVMALCLFAASYCQTAATGDFGMPAQLLYPLMKGGSLITVNLYSALCFGERITRRTVLGSAVALVGIIVMNAI